MYTAISILLTISCVLLVLVVLVQNSKGGGLAANFAGSNQTLGVRQTADILEKATWTLGVVMFVLCVMGTAFTASNDVSGTPSTVKEQAGRMPSQSARPEFPTTEPAPANESAPQEQAPQQ